MAQNEASSSTDEESLKNVFEEAMKMFERIENSNEATNSDEMQMTIKQAIAKFEKATNLVSVSNMFSSNEDIEELPTETLQYLLLPALLGTLTLKLCGQPRKDVIITAEIYFRDYLQRCQDYGVIEAKITQNSSNETNAKIQQNEKLRISDMININQIQTREEKIARYKAMVNLKNKLSLLREALALPDADEDTKRQYFITLLVQYVNQSFDELSSIENETPILEYMTKHAGEQKPSQRERAPKLKPVIITRDAVQKAVFGAGYPALPTMTVEEFYDKRVRDGTFPAAGSNIPHATIQNAEADANETDEIRKERLREEDDPEELSRQRNMDEYKDEHRRGSGNRHNRS